MEIGRTSKRSARTARTAVGALALALLATIVPVALGPSAPAAAAPPAVTHGGLVNPNPIDTTPHVIDGRTEAVLDLGSRVIVGGTFTKVKKFSVATQYSRSYLFAYDKATGNIDTTFLPQPNGKVTALLRAPDGKVLVSGQFKSIGGRATQYVAKIDPVTGAAVSGFAPQPTGMVYDMHLAGGHLYIGGTFTKVGSTARTNFAAIDPGTGAVRTVGSAAFASAPRGITRVMRFDVSPDGKKLVAIGNFARVGGQVRENIAVLDLTASGGSTVAGWRTDRYKDLTCGNTGSSWDTPTYDVDMAPDGSWFVVVTTGGRATAGKLCDTATRWATGTNGVASPTWINYTGADSLTSVAVTGAAVYVAGHNRWLDNPAGSDSGGPGSVARQGIGALSPSTGKALSWNPGRERGLVAPRLVATAEGLYVLSDSDFFAGEYHPKLTYLTLTGSLPPTGSKPSAPGVPTVAGAGATTATITWEAATASSAITGYTVVARTGTTTVATKDVAANVRSTGLTGLPAGKVVTFSVTARTAAGEGPAATTAPAVPPFTSVDAFTTRQFRDLVGRAPTSSELSTWRTQVGGGTKTPQAAIDGLLGGSSVEKVAAVVRLYRAYYLRNPDAAGFRYWRDQVRRGVSVDKVSQSFAGAAEFRTLYGRLDDGEFVDLVYENVLGRTPDASGRSYWVSQLRKGVTRGKVMTGFSESGENKTATRRATDIILVVHLMLDRPPSSTEKAWTVSRAEMARTVLVSPEYDSRV